MPLVKKYMLFILLLANMTAEYKLLASISQVFFYSILAISALVILMNFGELISSLKKTPSVKWLMLIYLIAQFILQYDIISTENVVYTITKIVVFCIISLSICSNFNFYLKQSPIIFSYMILGLVLLGWFVNLTGEYGNLQFGFANRNVACTIATAGFAGFLFMRDKFRLFDIACIVFLFVTVLYGGSRNALAMCVLIIVVRYGFSFKIVTAGALFLALVLFVLPELGMEVTGFDRLVGTFEGTVATDRDDVIRCT